MNLRETIQYANYLLNEVYTSEGVKDDLRKKLIGLESKISKYGYKIILTDEKDTKVWWKSIGKYEHYWKNIPMIYITLLNLLNGSMMRLVHINRRLSLNRQRNLLVKHMR